MLDYDKVPNTYLFSLYELTILNNFRIAALHPFQWNYSIIYNKDPSNLLLPVISNCQVRHTTRKYSTICDGCRFELKPVFVDPLSGFEMHCRFSPIFVKYDRSVRFY